MILSRAAFFLAIFIACRSVSSDILSPFKLIIIPILADRAAYETPQI
jgi:hypothetical protein